MLEGEQKAGLNAGGTAEHNKYIVSRPGICNRIPGRDFCFFRNFFPEYKNTAKSAGEKEEVSKYGKYHKRRDH